jgi:hypothetical protein
VGNHFGWGPQCLGQTGRVPFSVICRTVLVLTGRNYGGLRSERQSVQQATECEWLKRARDSRCAEPSNMWPTLPVSVTCVGGWCAERDSVQQATEAEWLMRARDSRCAEPPKTPSLLSVAVTCVGWWHAEKERRDWAYSKRLKMAGSGRNATLKRRTVENSAAFVCTSHFRKTHGFASLSPVGVRW